MRYRPSRMLAGAAALVAALAALPSSAAQIDLGLSVSDGRLRSFYLAVGDHYRVAPTLVVDYRSRYRLLDEELPVVFFLAARARVAPKAIVDLRLRKTSWFGIAVHFGLSPEIFFVPVGLARIGPPYGNAYGYYRKRGRTGDWRGFAPRDEEIVDLVNLRFLAEYHGVPADTIIGRRGQGRSFVAIHDEAVRAKGKGSPAGRKAPAKPPKSRRK